MEQTCGAPPLTAMAGWFIWAGQPTSTLQNFRRIDWLHLPLNQIDDEAGLSHPNFKLMVEERYSDLHASLPAAEIERRLTSIEVPTRVVCGWYDEMITENLTNYERQAKGGGDVSLVVGPWHHNLEDIAEARIGQLPVPEVYLNRYYLEMERFLEHYLKAGATTPLEAPGRVLLYVMGSDVWRYEQEWPLGRAVTTPLFLSSGGSANTDQGDGELLWQPPAGEQPADTYAYNPLDPVRSVAGLGVWNLFTVGQMGDRAAIESRDDVLVYSTAPLEQDLEVTGTIEATLHAASSAVDTDFIINLIDVHPDGFTQYITQGLVRASYREGLGARKLIEPGKVYDYRLSFRPTSICFLKGHRIRIEVTSSDMDRHARNQNVADAPGTTANVAIAQQTIHHSGLRCSRLDLPVIPAVAATGSDAGGPAASQTGSVLRVWDSRIRPDRRLRPPALRQDAGRKAGIHVWPVHEIAADRVQQQQRRRRAAHSVHAGDASGAGLQGRRAGGDPAAYRGVGTRGGGTAGRSKRAGPHRPRSQGGGDSPEARPGAPHYPRGQELLTHQGAGEAVRRGRAGTDRYGGGDRQAASAG